MVYIPSSISVCKSVDQTSLMPVSMNLSDSGAKSKHNNHIPKTRKLPNLPNCSTIPYCDRSRSAVVDVVILIAVIFACGFLILPSLKFLFFEAIELFGIIMDVLKEEISQAPLIYGSVVLSICSAALAAWGVLACTSRKCGNPNCKGLRKAAEFDIQLETEECVKNSASSSSSSMVKDGVKKGLFELPRDHHRELEAELKKMAPPNGRAVLIFRARCGCSVGRLEVPGIKKQQQRKIKK
ncbi:hypothetical protein CsatB_021706 [Cannabis sativa]|uniref:Ribosomal protein L34e superfamily protein n=1 Tax=Cannabis sativa TaxID=3483 RepID=A0A803QMG9_CANSA|nr:uncharacterized protein At5g19025 [Cannabis sativa]